MPITGVIIIFYAIYHTIAVLRGEEEAIAEDDNPDVI
jgi:succinate dehydrogenase hydrophobic anchor subunit